MDLAFVEANAKRTEGAAPRAKRLTQRHRNVLRQLQTIVAVAMLSVGAYFFISRYFFQTVEVVGVSMSPTLKEHGLYLLDRWALNSRDPVRRDIVVIRDPADQGISVKRVIAQAGDTVSFGGGKVFVNGRELYEPYLRLGTKTLGGPIITGKPFVCGPDQFVVLGDNRQASIDSRVYGAVPRANILGLVLIR